MARSMLRIMSAEYVVFFEKDEMELAKEFRKSHPVLKYKKIKEVLQMNPELIPLRALIRRWSDTIQYGKEKTADENYS